MAAMRTTDAYMTSVRIADAYAMIRSQSQSHNQRADDRATSVTQTVSGYQMGNETVSEISIRDVSMSLG